MMYPNRTPKIMLLRWTACKRPAADWGRLLLAVVLFTVFFGSTACSKDHDPVTPELIVSTEKVSISNAGETKPFHVKSNVDWTVSSSESWLTLTPASGGNGTHKIEIQAAENPNLTDRKAIITVRAGTLTSTVEVVQSASRLFKVNINDIDLDKAGQVVKFTVESSAPYTIAFDVEWLAREAPPVQQGNTYEEAITVLQNSNIFERNGTITLTLDGETLLVSVMQKGNSLFVDADPSGMVSDAPALASKMRVGWNLGNALEAASSEEVANETLWGNPKTSKSLIDAVKAAGFNAVRIPAAWSGYIEDRTTHRIKEAWLVRVKEVVDYCVGNGMYAIINIHWDGGWLEEHPFYEHQVAVNAKQKALWEQIAAYFRDYDEHLLFAGTNEVRAGYSDPTTEHIEVQQSYNQTFVDAVRSTGGRNAYRNLIVQAYNTNIQFAIDHLEMPDDQTANRLMAEVHYYDPWDFAGNESSMEYLWGSAFANSPNVSTWGQEPWVDKRFQLMKSHFVDKGIPVVLGEYGAILRSGLTDPIALQNHKKARNAYLTYVTKAAKANGLIPFYWDNGVVGNNGFGLFNRNNNAVAHPDAVEAIMSGL